jgi:transcription elongation factor Elf1
MNTGFRIGHVGEGPGQDARIAQHEALLKRCPFCGCHKVRLYNIDSYGRFMYARCTRCRAQASPEAWQRRAYVEQLTLFVGVAAECDTAEKV